MISVGEDTFFSVLGVYGSVVVKMGASQVVFYHGGIGIAAYDRMKDRYLVKSEDIRRLTESGRLDSH